ncbi:MAG: glycosyltransferase family 39 protein [Chloroflexota bacterium]
MRLGQQHRTVLLVLLLWGAFTLRVFRIENQSYWWDEGISLGLATSTWAEIWINRLNNIHPPLYFFLLKLWVTLTGVTPFATRTFSALASLMQVTAVFTTTRYFFRSTRLALLSAFFVAISPLAIIYGQEVRVYALLPLIFFGLILGMAHLIRSEGVGRRSGWVFFGTTIWFGLHLHYIAAFMVLFVGLWGVITFAVQKTWLKVRDLAITAVIVGFASLPWFGSLAYNLISMPRLPNRRTYLAEPVPFDFLIEQIWLFHFTGLAGASNFERIWLSGMAIGFIAVGILLFMFWRQVRQNGRFLLWFTIWFVPLFSALIVWSVRSFSHPRYISMFAMGLFPLLAYLIFSFEKVKSWPFQIGLSVLGVGLFTAVSIISVLALNEYFFNPAIQKDDMRGVAQYLAENAGANDLILIPDAGHALRFENPGLATIVEPQIAQEDALWANLSDWSSQPRTLYRVMDEADLSAKLGVLPYGLEMSGYLVKTVLFDGLLVAQYELSQPVTLPQMQPIGAQYESLRLETASVEQDVATDTAVTIALTWEKTAVDPRRLNISLRMRDNELQLEQTDHLLLDSLERPTDFWEVGERVTTYHLLPVDGKTPPLAYDITLLVYDRDDNGANVLIPFNQPDPFVTIGQSQLVRAIGVDDPYAVNKPSPLYASPQSMADGLNLLGATSSSTVDPGQSLPVTLIWQAIASDLPNYEPAVVLLQDNVRLAEFSSAPAQDRYPTSEWQIGEQVRDLRFLQIPPTASGNAALFVELENTAVKISDVQISDTLRSFEQPEVDVEINRTLGEIALLVGYRLENTAVSNENPLPITLIWQSLAENVPTNYSVFVHLLASDGRIVGQHDGQPVAGNRPTAGWIAAEYFEDVHPVSLTDPDYQGSATLAVGFYNPATGDRLLTPDGRDTIPLDNLIIQVGTTDE